MSESVLDLEVLLDWLLDREEPWVVLNARLDLLGQSQKETEVRDAYRELQEHPAINALLRELETWPQERRLVHAYDPKDALWKLAVLADFGLKRDNDRIAALAERVIAAQASSPAPAGFLQGGFAHTKSWDQRPYICVSHVMTYALARFGYLDNPGVQRAYDYLVEWQRLDGGWHPNEACLPGNTREEDPSCPFGTVNILRAVAVHPSLRDGDVAKRGVQFILMCWERRHEPYRPIGFGMGGVFSKLQYPFVQHQVLKTVDTLSNFDSALADERFIEMLALVTDKRTDEGLFKADGTNSPFASFDFGQKKGPSPWITFLIARAHYRLNQYRMSD